MRAFFIALWVLVVAPLTYAAPSSAAIRKFAVSDLIGSWDCVGSVPGSLATERYEREGPNAIVLDNEVHTSTGVTGTVVETFSYDRKLKMARLSAPANLFFDGMNLIKREANATSFAFIGTERFQEQSRPVRIVYTITGNGRFRREHQRKIDGTWVDDGAYVCHRHTELAAVKAHVPADRPNSVSRSVSRPRPTPSPRPTPRPTPTPTLRPTPTPTPRPTPTPTPRPTPTPTPRPTPTPTPRPTPTPTPLPTPTPTPLPTAPPTPLPTPTPTPLPTAPPTPQPTPSPTPIPTEIATARPTFAPTPDATQVPTLSPTAKPSAMPSATARIALGERHLSPKTPTRDRALSLPGVWDCAESSGAPSRLTFARSGDVLHVHSEVVIARKLFAVTETYTYDAGNARWHTTTQDDAYSGVAPKWIGDTWTFQGTVPQGNTRVPVRMRYVALGSNAFRREYQRSENGVWTTFHSETCHRK